MTPNSDLPEISYGSGSLVYTADGRSLIDLVNGFGTVFLGHAHPDIVAGLQRQLSRIWSCGRLPTPARHEIEALLGQMLPAGYKPGGMYSTGMEVVEFALRLAASHTGRKEFVGFARSMHGKSAMTAGLCWSNALIGSDLAHVLPFVDDTPEPEILERLTDRLRARPIAAVLVEPLQGSNGGHQASSEFYRQIVLLCRQYGALSIFDEILTGLYRTGMPFYISRLAEPPDVLLFAKSMANGFPASAIAIREGIDVPASALPGSTFAGNPLAAAAAVATLSTMKSLPMVEMVARIDGAVRAGLASCQEFGITLRGSGALWALEVNSGVHIGSLLQSIQAEEVLVSAYGRYIRLLPAATIDPELLADACARIMAACRSTAHRRS